VLGESYTGQPIDWKPVIGKWEINDGSIIQKDHEKKFTLIVAKDYYHLSSYILTLKARKINGKEGFIIYFHIQAGNRFLLWNIGGWNNTGSAIEYNLRSSNQHIVTTYVEYTVDIDRWYDIKPAIDGLNIKGYIDGIEIFSDKLPDKLSSSGTFGLSTWNTAVE
jgi:hypothetical protein